MLEHVKQRQAAKSFLKRGKDEGMKKEKVVMEAYEFDWRTMTESECVAELMKKYQKLNED